MNRVWGWTHRDCIWPPILSLGGSGVWGYCLTSQSLPAASVSSLQMESSSAPHGPREDEWGTGHRAPSMPLRLISTPRTAAVSGATGTLGALTHPAPSCCKPWTGQVVPAFITLLKAPDPSWGSAEGPWVMMLGLTAGSPVLLSSCCVPRCPV